MKTWTPLFSSIVDSSVWGEDKDTKILWITLLAKKDRDGFVEMSLPGLARAAVLTLKECERSLKVLQSPDPHSRTKEHEGRRVKEVPGGWMVLNHALYRDEIARARQREQQRQWQAKYRLVKKQRPLPGETAEMRALARGDGDHAERLAQGE